LKEVGIDDDSIVGTNSEEVSIKRGVMNFAERDSIGNDRFSIVLRVADDVGCVEKFAMP
jgi:hypothetical protein